VLPPGATANIDRVRTSAGTVGMLHVRYERRFWRW
jgi:hypothetical protein